MLSSLHSYCFHNANKSQCQSPTSSACESTVAFSMWLAQYAVPPTNTKFKPLLLPAQAGIPYTSIHKHRTSYLKSTLTFLGPAKHRKSISADRQKLGIFAILHHHNLESEVS